MDAAETSASNCIRLEGNEAKGLHWIGSEWMCVSKAESGGHLFVAQLRGPLLTLEANAAAALV